MDPFNSWSDFDTHQPNALRSIYTFIDNGEYAAAMKVEADDGRPHLGTDCERAI
jgi:hypothetical protein